MNAKILTVLALSAALFSTAALGLDEAKVSPTTAQVVNLHQSNVGVEVLLAYVKEAPIAKPTAEEVLYLTEKGVPKEVIVAMLSKRVWADAAAAQSEPAPKQTDLPPAVAPAKPATQTVVVQQPASTVTYVAPPAVYYPRSYYPYYPYYSYPYYSAWPSVSVGLGFGYYWGHGHHHHYHHGHHGGGIHVHRRR